VCHPEAAADALRVALEGFSQEAGEDVEADIGALSVPEGGRMVLCMEVRGLAATSHTADPCSPSRPDSSLYCTVAEFTHIDTTTLLLLLYRLPSNVAHLFL
jgi:hypothetical protein